MSEITYPVPAAVPPVSAPAKLGKLKASWLIVKESWGVLIQDKEVMWFPVISGLVSTMAVVLMLAAYFQVILGGSFSNISSANGPSPIIQYGTFFVYYLVTFLIANFFQAGMLIIIDARFHGQNLGLGDGMAGAFKNFGKILVWSLISATVGLIFKIIEDRGKIFGAVIVWFLGAAWNILTYFSLPALIVGGATITGSFKESAASIRKTWGEAIVVNFGVSLFIGLVLILSAIVAGVLSIGLVVLQGSAIEATIGLGIIWGLWILFTIVMSIVSLTLSVIFKLALFEYAKNGTIPTGFSPELIQGAIKRK